MAWSAGYWLLGAAALAVFIKAFGSGPGVAALLVAFGAGNVVAFVPVTPRGLGTLEFTIITVFTAFGQHHGTVVLGVLAWRLVSFWAPIPVGLLCYLWLSAREPREPRETRETREHLADDAP